jgi:hypothetical protein
MSLLLLNVSNFYKNNEGEHSARLSLLKNFFCLGSHDDVYDATATLDTKLNYASRKSEQSVVLALAN